MQACIQSCWMDGERTYQEILIKVEIEMVYIISIALNN
jgi:hypothetical protein